MATIHPANAASTNAPSLANNTTKRGIFPSSHQTVFVVGKANDFNPSCQNTEQATHTVFSSQNTTQQTPHTITKAPTQGVFTKFFEKIAACIVNIFPQAVHIVGRPKKPSSTPNSSIISNESKESAKKTDQPAQHSAITNQLDTQLARASMQTTLASCAGNLKELKKLQHEISLWKKFLPDQANLFNLIEQQVNSAIAQASSRQSGAS